jgi:positive regulator of sigma E activity
MKDNGIVIALQGPLAQVQVDCAQACQECSASSLCKGATQKEGLLSVRNPLNAVPGDTVLIQVPEERYHRILIKLFGGLLAAAVIGSGTGYGLAGPLPLEESLSALVGFFLGLGLAVPVVIHSLKKASADALYPSIIDITRKGERHA